MSTAVLDAPPSVHDDATRREFLAGLAAAGLLAGCGREKAAAPPPPTAVPPRKVRDFFGNDVDVPFAPQRIVAADDTALGNLLDLGVRPVATAVNLLSVPTFLGRRTEGIEDISTADGIRLNVERLAALRPELVFTIGVEFNQEKYEKLRAVAPTFAYAYGYASSEQIRANMTELGRALGQEARAAAEVAKLDGRVASMRQRWPRRASPTSRSRSYGSAPTSTRSATAAPKASSSPSSASPARRTSGPSRPSPPS